MAWTCRGGRLVLVVALAAAVTVPAAAEAARSCPHAGDPAGRTAAAPLRRAVVCLINRRRRRHRLPAVHSARLLARAAFRHARDMARHHYFAHDGRDGRGFDHRIARTGYLRGRRRWSLGETLAWGAGRVTPAALVRTLMHSPPHRAVILARRFREIGIGLLPRSPYRRRGATLVVDFGVRGPRGRHGGPQRDRHGRRRPPAERGDHGGHDAPADRGRHGRHGGPEREHHGHGRP